MRSFLYLYGLNVGCWPSTATTSPSGAHGVPQVKTTKKKHI